MTSDDLTLPISYFGKLPTQGDFVRAANNHRPLIAILDRWATEGLDLLAQDVAWKTLYDSAPGFHFAFMGSRHRSVIGGHLLPSVDASGRRFPFMAGVTFEVAKPLEFIARSPLAFIPMWSRLGRELPLAKQAGEPAPILNELSEHKANLTVSSDTLHHTFAGFLQAQTMGSLQQMLNTAGHQVDVRRILLALGLLLRPVMSTGAPKMGKGLRLPLPSDPLHRHLVSAFWLDLIAAFLGRADFELMLLQRGEHQPTMTLGFGGASARGLYGVIDPRIEEQDTIWLADPQWVEQEVSASYALKKMSTYTSQPELSLSTARDTFRETFLGL
ncbi:type VI secretion system-associated protein TagF [Pseudomonas sp. 18175]|uniref:type VI secretion system-associated protein TagF n=1 Tax=Pseudomonas sp. 18175 TaxID=3390056 RepID=UPI003D1DF988